MNRFETVNNELIIPFSLVTSLYDNQNIQPVDNKDGKSSVWNTFQIFEHIQQKKTVFGFCICKNCHLIKEYKTIDQNKRIKYKGTNILSSHQLNCSNQNPSIKPFVTKKIKFSEENKLDVTEQIANLFVSNNYSLASIENKHWSKLIENIYNLNSNKFMINIENTNLIPTRGLLRKTILFKSQKIIQNIKDEIKIPIKNNSLSATTDIYTNDHTKKSYINFIIFWISTTYSIKSAIIDCTEFKERKTSINIENKIKDAFQNMNINYLNIPITTDCGSNILKATATMLRVVCFCHRLNTVINNLIAETNSINNFKELFTNISELTEYVTRSEIKSKIVPKIRSGGKTRPWRYYINLCSDLNFHNNNETNLKELLLENKKFSLYEKINFNLLEELHKVLILFKPIFDGLETKNSPTINKVIPFYYYLKSSLNSLGLTSETALMFKDNLLNRMKMKYKTSFSSFHWIGTFLDPYFKTFNFLTPSKRIDKINWVEGLIQQQEERLLLKIEPSSHNTTERNTPHSQSKTDSSYKVFDAQQFSSIHQSNIEINHETLSLATELEEYGADTDVFDDSLKFWMNKKRKFPLLHQLEIETLVIQGSSAEAERSFSAVGNILSSKRTRTKTDLLKAKLTIMSWLIQNDDYDFK